MKPSETESIYESACKARRMTPEQEEGRSWHRVLRAYEASDVKTGLEAWWASTERDSKGELKSKWLPAPAELKPLVEQAKHRREVASAAPKDYVGWECSSRKCRYRCGGFVAPENREIKRCPLDGCGAVMNEMVRERAA